jgi:serine/threonine protein kinase
LFIRFGWSAFNKGFRAMQSSSRSSPCFDFINRLVGPRAPQALPEATGLLVGSMKLDKETEVGYLIRSPSGESFKKKYEVGKQGLGTGMSGTVMKGKDIKSGLDVAVKTLPIGQLTDLQREQTIAEISNQLKLDHPNICKIFSVYVEPERIILAIERMKGPNLLDHLNTKGDDYTEQDAGNCVYQMLKPVAYIHSHGVIHRDLKLENFCLEEKESENNTAKVKMIDFGLSETFIAGVPLTHACGSLLYVAPEVLKRSYTEKADVWSMGVIAYALLFGQPPFTGNNDRELCKSIKCDSLKFPDRSGVTNTGKLFVQRLLKKEPAERPTAAKALEDHWIQRHKVAKQELSLGFAVHDVVQLSESEADVQKELKANAADGVSVWDASMEGMLGKEFPILQIKSEKVIALSPDDSEDKKYFPASVLKKVKLATSVIDGLKLLSQSNELKQRLLCLMAPTASADKVQVWAKQFEEQDEAGSGMVKVKDMVSMLIKHQNCSKDEAEQITSSLQALSDGDLVSYSAFLAACLSSHMAKHMKDSDLQGLFKRMDKDHDGTVSLEEVKEVFGDDVIGEEQLKEVMGSKNHLTLSDLRWLLFNPTNEAVHKDKLDGLFKAKEVNRIWKTRGKKSRRANRELCISQDGYGKIARLN